MTDRMGRRIRSRLDCDAGGPLVGLLMLVLLATHAAAQPTFSVDYQGPPKAAISGCGPFAIQEDDILVAVTGFPALGPLPLPCIVISGGFGPPFGPGLGLPMHAGPIPPPGVPGLVEVDALSYGFDARPDPNMRPGDILWFFSVDEWAMGIPGSPAPPNVFTQGFFGTAEASADVFIDTGVGPSSMCAMFPVIGNTSYYDGNGLLPTGLPGFGLIEPNPAAPGLPDAGTNLDALDIDSVPPLSGPGAFPVYFSLDSGPAVFDFLEGIPGSGSAAANGPWVGGHVLVRVAPAGPTLIYAPAPMLGLDIFGPDTDDLDALALAENGVPGYQPPFGPYSWLPAFGGADALFFSVRRGSAVIGMPDFLCGLPIEPGDILIPPPPGSGLPPGVWITAESIGLATVRSGTARLGVGDDLDALDVALDCNHNRISDITDIQRGTSLDANGNGIPDECEFVCKPCDLNCDGTINAFDIQPFVNLLSGVGGPCSPCAGDANGDGSVNAFDIQSFIDCLNGP